jgi:hypothetical protein
MSGGEDLGLNGLGNSYPALWCPELTKANKRRIRADYFILKSVKLRFDNEKVGATVRSDAHKVCLYETMFCAGFRLPYSRVVQELLSHLHQAPHQIVPNAWRVFYTCTVLWPMVLGKGNFLTYREFLWMYESRKI